MASVRLYVGGLPAGVTAPELEARFTPFGEVTDMQLAPAKQYGDAAFSRDFAHVSLRPKDEAALRKCISVYNGCKWKGGVLKCGLARQHYAERLAAERAGGAGSGGPEQDAEDAAQPALPPLEPGTVLRLRPPKAPTHVEVQLGSGAKLSSFPEAAASGARPVGEAGWEPLPTPPRSGYRFEALLQRIAAELPPELMAAVEERRERGRRLAEARQAAAQQAAGTAVAYHYSDGEVSGEEGSESLQLESDDDAGTAAAAAAAMVAARERRLAATAAGRPAPAEAGGNKPRQQEQPRDPRRQHRLGVVEFLQGAEQPAVGDGGCGAADLSRFDSDSDAEWVGPPAAARRQPAAQGQAAQLAKRQRQQQAAQAQQPPAKQPRQQEPEALPSGSSGSSGGSELEEWLAGGHVGSPASSGSGGTSGSEGGEDGGEEQSDGAAEWASSGGADDASEQEASSGGSELEEWLAHAGEGGTSSADEEGQRPGRAAADSGQGSPAGMRRPERQAGGQQQPQQLPQQQQAPQPPQQQQAPQQARHQQRGVVDFLEGGEATGRQWWQKPPPAIDLDRFASSSEDEGAAPGAPQQAAPHGTKRRRQECTIPQVDGAADTDSDSEEETSSSDGEGSSEDGSGGSNSGEGEEESGDSGSEEDEGASAGSSSSEEEDSESSDGEGEPAAAASTPAKQQAAGGKAQGRNSSGSSGSSSSEDEDEDAADGAAAAAAAAAAAEEQRQLAALAALFPEGAAFQRNEPLPQLEATWRASREGWAQDYRQKHRQAVRLLGRAGGGGGKRQRKG